MINVARKSLFYVILNVSSFGGDEMCFVDKLNELYGKDYQFSILLIRPVGTLK